MKLMFRISMMLVLSVLVTVALSSTGLRDHISLVVYDLTHSNEPVLESEQASAILRDLGQTPCSGLPAEYLQRTGFDAPEYRKLVENRLFYQVGRKDMYRKIAGNARIRDFLPKDRYLEELVRGKRSSVYWLVDPDLLFKVAELQRALILEKYHSRAFRVISSYRYPSYNRRIGGVPHSCHITGGAVDILVLDVNNDRRYTHADKEIVYEMLDRQIIGQEGGLGRYPGRRTIHFDTRGKLARWDY